MFIGGIILLAVASLLIGFLIGNTLGWSAGNLSGHNAATDDLRAKMAKLRGDLVAANMRVQALEKSAVAT